MFNKIRNYLQKKSDARLIKQINEDGADDFLFRIGASKWMNDKSRKAVKQLISAVDIDDPVIVNLSNYACENNQELAEYMFEQFYIDNNSIQVAKKEHCVNLFLATSEGSSPCDEDFYKNISDKHKIEGMYKGLFPVTYFHLLEPSNENAALIFEAKKVYCSSPMYISQYLSAKWDSLIIEHTKLDDSIVSSNKLKEILVRNGNKKEYSNIFREAFKASKDRDNIENYCKYTDVLDDESNLIHKYDSYDVIFKSELSTVNVLTFINKNTDDVEFFHIVNNILQTNEGNSHINAWISCDLSPKRMSMLRSNPYYEFDDSIIKSPTIPQGKTDLGEFTL